MAGQTRRARSPRAAALVPPEIKAAPMPKTSNSAASVALAAIAVSMPIEALITRLAEDEGFAAQGGLQVVGPQQGRRRAGRAFGPQAQVIPLVLLGEDELRAIDSDALLSWSIVPIDSPAAPDTEDEA